jgi:hypothetical protein
MRLHFIGTVLADRPHDEAENPYLWNLELPGHIRNRSTLTLATLRDLGLLKGGSK